MTDQPMSVEQALDAITDAFDELELQGYRVPLAAIRAHIAQQAATIEGVRAAWQHSSSAIRYEADLATEDGHDMRANAYHHAIAIIESKFAAALAAAGKE